MERVTGECQPDDRSSKHTGRRPPKDPAEEQPREPHDQRGVGRMKKDARQVVTGGIALP
jgi:hypothetical protein